MELPEIELTHEDTIAESFGISAERVKELYSVANKVNGMKHTEFIEMVYNDSDFTMEERLYLIWQTARSVGCAEGKRLCSDSGQNIRKIFLS